MFKLFTVSTFSSKNILNASGGDLPMLTNNDSTLVLFAVFLCRLKKRICCHLNEVEKLFCLFHIVDFYLSFVLIRLGMAFFSFFSLAFSYLVILHFFPL